MFSSPSGITEKGKKNWKNKDNLVLSPAHGIEDQFECFNYLSPLQRSVDIIVIKKEDENDEN